MEVEYFPYKENNDYTKEILTIDIDIPKSLSTNKLGQKDVSKYKKMLERYIEDANISFFTELMSDVDDDFEGTTRIYEYASDNQLERRKSYLLEKITSIEKIADWMNKPAWKSGYETLKDEHDRYKIEYDQIQQLLIDKFGR